MKATPLDIMPRYKIGSEASISPWNVVWRSKRSAKISDNTAVTVNCIIESFTPPMAPKYLSTAKIWKVKATAQAKRKISPT